MPLLPLALETRVLFRVTGTPVAVGDGGGDDLVILCQ